MSKKLIITGSGIKSLSHLTLESQSAMEQADIVLYLVNEPITAQWIEKKARKSDSLDDLYFSETLRSDAYKKIVERVLNVVEHYEHVCFVVYGHPLLLSNSVDYLLKQVDKSRVDVFVLPAISAFDCLLCDLEIDPFSGCFSIDSTEFLNKKQDSYKNSHLILWQIGMINDSYTEIGKEALSGMVCLQEVLLSCYESTHTCIFYEASMFPHLPPKIIKATIASMHQVPVSRITTLYIPPSSDGSKT